MSEELDARAKFRRGDWVVPTLYALRQGVGLEKDARRWTGVIVGFGRLPHLVRIKFRKLRRVETWAQTFWMRPEVSARQLKLRSQRKARQ